MKEKILNYQKLTQVEKTNYEKIQKEIFDSKRQIEELQKDYDN